MCGWTVARIVPILPVRAQRQNPPVGLVQEPLLAGAIEWLRFEFGAKIEREARAAGTYCYVLQLLTIQLSCRALARVKNTPSEGPRESAARCCHVQRLGIKRTLELDHTRIRRNRTKRLLAVKQHQGHCPHRPECPAWLHNPH
jgi:hypothetical protein